MTAIQHPHQRPGMDDDAALAELRDRVGRHLADDVEGTLDRRLEYGLTADTDRAYDVDLYDDAPPEAVPTLEALGGALSGVACAMAGVVYLVRRGARRG